MKEILILVLVTLVTPQFSFGSVDIDGVTSLSAILPQLKDSKIADSVVILWVDSVDTGSIVWPVLEPIFESRGGPGDEVFLTHFKSDVFVFWLMSESFIDVIPRCCSFALRGFSSETTYFVFADCAVAGKILSMRLKLLISWVTAANAYFHSRLLQSKEPHVPYYKIGVA